jgi:hypothetical protein
LLFSILTILAGNSKAQHIEIGGFGDYEDANAAGFPHNAFGVGGPSLTRSTQKLTNFVAERRKSRSHWGR